MPESSKQKENAKSSSKRGKNNVPKSSSKTSRVLGLLTSPAPSEEPVAEQKPAAAPVLKSASDEAVEAQIRDALEELIGPSPEESGQETTPSREPKPVSLEELEPDFQEEPEHIMPKSEKLGPQSVKTAMSKELIEVEGEISDEDLVCFNVMQALVKPKVEKYMKLFGLCTCPRCQIDVVALSLTNLPPKYIVAKGHELVPLLSVYEGHFNTAVVSQVINSCKLVMQHPRH